MTRMTLAGRERHEELQVGSHLKSPQSETPKPSQSNKLKNDQNGDNVFHSVVVLKIIEVMFPRQFNKP